MDERYTSTFEGYMMFRMSEAEHIEKAYNGNNNSQLNANGNALIGSGESDDEHRIPESIP